MAQTRTEDEIKLKISQTLYTCGVDEVGAGVLAGSLIVSSVILPFNHKIKGLTDSKKLSAKKREELYPQIIEAALDYSIVEVSHLEVDEINILQARMRGMERAVASLTKFPAQYAIIDGNRIPPNLLIEADYVIKGDLKIQCVSAASILAKVFRDKQITEQAQLYPGYNWESNKGYGTKDHVAAIERLGPCEIHRKTFAPIKHMLAKK